MNKWTIILFFLFIAVSCGKNQSSTEGNSVTEGNLGLGMTVPNFESNVSQKNGVIVIPHEENSGVIIQFERKNYLVDEHKTNPTAMKLIKKLFRHDVDVRPYEQNSNGTYYRAKFVGRFNMDSLSLQFLQVY